MNEYRQGEHICVVYRSIEEQLAVAAEYLADGLRRGERAYYVADSAAALRAFNEALAARGIDDVEALRTTALIEATHAEAHLVDGRFDSERMLRLLNEGIESALNAGFTGLRTCGDMSWLLGDPPGADQVVEYEALLNPMFLGTSAVIDRQHRPNPFYRPSQSAGRRFVPRPR
jgi:hypothetical protein